VAIRGVAELKHLALSTSVQLAARSTTARHGSSQQCFFSEFLRASQFIADD